MKRSASPARASHSPVLARRPLERAGRGRAHRDHPAALAPRALDRVGGGGRDLHRLGLHSVPLHRPRAQRPEGAGPDVEREVAHLDARDPRAAPSSSGVKCRPAVGAATEPVLARVDRLVALAVLGLGRVVPGDVGRQRRQPMPLHQLPDRPRRLDRDDARALRALPGDARVRERRPPAPRARPRGSAGPGAPSPPSARPPRGRSSSSSTAPAPLDGGPEQPRGHHPAPVGHQAIPRPQQLRQLAEPAVLPRPRRPVEHEQPRGIPRLRRLLRDQPRRQLIIEGGNIHVAQQCIALRPTDAVATHGRRPRALEHKDA